MLKDNGVSAQDKDKSSFRSAASAGTGAPVRSASFSQLSKLAHYAKVFVDYRIRKQDVLDYVPEDILVEVTNVCNFKCAFCAQADPKHHDLVPKTYLPPERAAMFLTKLRQGGVRTNTIHWTHDGEPFMNKRFHELCGVGLEYGFSNMYFATNGMLCTPDRLDSLPKDAKYTFIIDFCADPDTFEDIRGTRGSWIVVKDNITKILTDDAYAHMSLEVKDISSFNETDPERVQSNFAKMKALFPSSSRVKFFTKTFHNGTGFMPMKNDKDSGSYFLCPYPWTSLSVSSNGDVVACCRDLQHKSVLGNLLRQSLDEIWNGAEMTRMRRMLRDKRPDQVYACAGCDMPYDSDKFAPKNILRTVVGRLQLFNGR